jgi:hypothetical protein
MLRDQPDKLNAHLVTRKASTTTPHAGTCTQRWVTNTQTSNDTGRCVQTALLLLLTALHIEKPRLE